jgi:hypothetical protein
MNRFAELSWSGDPLRAGVCAALAPRRSNLAAPVVLATAQLVVAAALALVGATSFVGGRAGGAVLLRADRAVQDVGGALLFPASLSPVNPTFVGGVLFGWAVVLFVSAPITAALLVTSTAGRPARSSAPYAGLKPTTTREKHHATRPSRTDRPSGLRHRLRHLGVRR